MKLAKTVYDRSPVWAQNLLLSGYGLALWRARYGGIYPRQLESLLDSQWDDREQWRQRQAHELRRLLSHAQREVPWYRELFERRGLSAERIDPDNLGSLLPTLSKEELRGNQPRFIAEKLPGRRHIINTSGTTGSPLTIVATSEALQKNYAFFERFLRSVGIASGDRSATFAGRMLLPPTQQHPPYWRRNWAMNTLLCSSYHISERTADDYLRCLAEFAPVFIDAYPSAVYALAQHLIERRRVFAIRPKAIVTSSETLLDHQRALIEQAFDCPVFDQYGSAEMAACVTQCERGGYHVNPEYGIVEVIGEDGRPVAPGEGGELVCTGFLNYAMPMIRYRIGDSAVLSAHACDCGRSSPLLESLLGRVDDMIVTVDGRRVGRLDPLFKGLSDIKETQIVQLAHDRIVVNIVPAAGYSYQTGVELIEALKMRVGQRMQIELCFLTEIPRTASGKFRAVVSELANTARGLRPTGAAIETANT